MESSVDTTTQQSITPEFLASLPANPRDLISPGDKLRLQSDLIEIARSRRMARLLISKELL